MSYQYIDTHAHLNLEAFADDVSAVAKTCTEKSVGVINIGTTLASSQKAVELAEHYEDQYAVIGLHPIQTTSTKNEDGSVRTEGEGFAVEDFTALVTKQKVVGVGECGFDYWHTEPDSYAVQEEAFIQQIQFANEHNLPLMIHTRDPKPGQESPTGRSVYADVYDVLAQYAKVPFTIHFYAGSVLQAEKFFELSGNVSFTGVITFKNAPEYHEVVQALPLDKMLAETDAPYVAPVPHRGTRAEPWMVIEVYKKIAELKNLDEELVRTQLLQNARALYKI